MSAARRALLAAGLAASSSLLGCAQNALFELYVELPPPIMIEGGGMARFARVVALPVVASSDTTFDGARSRVVPLVAGEQWLGLTVARAGGFSGQTLTTRVIYCEVEDDCDPLQPELWAGSEDLVFDAAFYVARTSCYAHSVPDADLADGLALPAAGRRVTACEVAGCTDDDFDEASADFCRLGSTQHFCAAGQSGDVCDRLHDTLRTRLAAGG